MFFKNGSLIEQSLVTATSGGTLTLTNTSQTYQIFTGSSAHTLKLPDATTMPNGRRFEVVNSSTGIITVQDNGNNAIGTVDAGTSKIFRLADNGTANGTYDITVGGSGGGLSAADSAQVAAAAAKSYSETTRVIKFNPEEVGGGFFTTIATTPTSKSYGVAASLLGFVHSMGGYSNSGPTLFDTNERYDIDAKYWLSRAVMPAALQTAGANTVLDKIYVIGGTNISATAQTSNYEFTQATNSWASKTALGSARGFPANFGLGDYSYVFQGLSNIYTDATAEMYSPTTNAWYARSNLPYASRSGRGFNLEKAGYALSGTQFAGPVASTAKFSEELNSWASYTSLQNGTENFAAYALNGFGYAAGGSKNPGPAYSTIVEELNPSSNSWKNVGQLPQNGGSGRQPTGASVFGVAITTNGTDSSSPSAQAEVFRNTSMFSLGSLKRTTATPAGLSVQTILNSITAKVAVEVRTDGDSWKSFVSGDSALKYGEALSSKFLPSGMIYVTAGNNNGTSSNANRRFDDVANSWTSKANVTVAKRYNNAFAIGSIAYLPGGWAGTEVATNYAYDDLTDAWSTRTSMPEVRRNAACFSIEGLGYVSSGWTTAVVNSMRRYNATTDAWTSMTNLDTALSLPGSCESQGMGYRFGGTTNDASGGLLNTASRYNATADAWSARANLGSTRGTSSVFSIENYPYICGSFTAGSPLSTVDRYNADLNTYTTMASLPAIRAFGGASRSPGYGFMQGGWDGSSGVATNYRLNPYSNAWDTRTAIPANTQDQGCNLFAPAPYRNFEVRVGIPAFYAGAGANVWTTRANMTTAQSGSSSGLLSSGEILNFGSQATQKFSPVLNSWMLSTSFTAVSSATYASGAGFTLQGRTYGFTGASSAGGPISGTWYFSEETSSWIASGNVPTARIRVLQSNAGVLNGFGYFTGGSNTNPNNTNYPQTDKFNPSTGTWSTVASTNEAASVNYKIGFTIDGFFYTGKGISVLGGTGVATMEVYNDAANTYSTLSNSYPFNGEGTIGGLFNGKAMGAGGWESNNSVLSSQVHNFNPASRSFSQRAGLPAAVAYQSQAADHLIGGYNGAASSATYYFADSVKQAVLSAGLKIS